MPPPDFRAIRKRLGLTQGRAAVLFGVDLRTWQNWEAGKRAPMPSQVLAVILDRQPELVAIAAEITTPAS